MLGLTGAGSEPRCPHWLPTEELFKCSALLISRDKYFLFIVESFPSRCGYRLWRAHVTTYGGLIWAPRESSHLVHMQNASIFHSPYPTSPEACASQKIYSVVKGSYEIISLKQIKAYLETLGVKLTNMSSLALFVFTFKK